MQESSDSPIAPISIVRTVTAWAKLSFVEEAAMAKSEAEWASLVADLTAELRATRADLARLRQLKAVSPGPKPMGDVIGQRTEGANRKPAP